MLIDLLVNGLDDLLLTVSKTVFVSVYTSLIVIGFGESAQLVSHDLLVCHGNGGTKEVA